MRTPLLVAHSLSKTFPPASRKEPPAAVLHGVSLSVAPGEMVSIVGPSGSGKSTLLYCLAGLESPTSGTVTLGGRDLASLSRSQLAALRREQLGFVFQRFNLITSLSAWENVALPARLSRRRVSSTGIDGALASVGLADHARKRPGQLSGGQQQRVAIARVLAQHPALVFADEPTGSLDTANGAEVLCLLREAASAGTAVVMVTHDLEAAALADRVLVLRDGSIHTEMHSPTPDAVLAAVRSAGSGNTSGTTSAGSEKSAGTLPAAGSAVAP
ncbi:putative ABC-type antimicrobial peptide transport system, ATPase component [Arthrobacter sp. PAMC 25486]|uniref:ABC transporter ATP-binding protein n=1 Tax=Arthrobacter sp. PAMC 25486 TaxID=1494608 RepID=UPI0005361223|nr:ABC transporter ATP-binding protein [Arthrobacter sp. PAMC 25486]AIY00058.1 putative ABC-type antimicrobial peptide transport system, ATPase component [Arthrobacter sp. PAMC 25486]